MPFIVNHGWPWTFWDLNKVIRPLTDLVAFDGDATDSFDMNAWRTADLRVTLMQEVLGYDRLATQNGDQGPL